MYKKALAILIFFLLGKCDISFCQVTEGRIIYDITYPENTFDSVVKKSLPNECLTYFSPEKMRMDISLGAGMINSILVDNVKEEVHVLTDVSGNKTDYFSNRKDLEKQGVNAGNYAIQTTDDERTIAGYKCHKAVATDTKGNTYTAWFTNEVHIANPNWNNQFSNVGGFLMEFSMMLGQLKMEMKARVVYPEKLAPEIFLVPEGYTLVSGSDLKKIIRGK
ncbi:MAG: hypothetical protein ABI772_07105 [Bacteroidota bacterium]